jgi:hypothetical protein
LYRSAAVGASRRIDAFVCESQSLDGLALYQMRLDNLVYVLFTYEAIPHPIRIDDNRGAMLTLVKTSRFVDADLRSQTGIFDPGFEQFTDCL